MEFQIRPRNAAAATQVSLNASGSAAQGVRIAEDGVRSLSRSIRTNVNNAIRLREGQERDRLIAQEKKERDAERAALKKERELEKAELKAERERNKAERKQEIADAKIQRDKEREIAKLEATEQFDRDTRSKNAANRKAGLFKAYVESPVDYSKFIDSRELVQTLLSSADQTRANLDESIYTGDMREGQQLIHGDNMNNIANDAIENHRRNFVEFQRAETVRELNSNAELLMGQVKSAGGSREAAENVAESYAEAGFLDEDKKEEFISKLESESIFNSTLNSLDLATTRDEKKQAINEFYDRRHLVTASQRAQIRNAVTRFSSDQFNSYAEEVQGRIKDLNSIHPDELSPEKVGLSLGRLRESIEQDKKVMVLGGVSEKQLDSLEERISLIPEVVDFKKIQHEAGEHFARFGGAALPEQRQAFESYFDRDILPKFFDQSIPINHRVATIASIATRNNLTQAGKAAIGQLDLRDPNSASMIAQLVTQPGAASGLIDNLGISDDQLSLGTMMASLSKSMSEPEAHAIALRLHDQAKLDSVNNTKSFSKVRGAKLFDDLADRLNAERGIEEGGEYTAAQRREEALNQAPESMKRNFAALYDYFSLKMDDSNPEAVADAAFKKLGWFYETTGIPGYRQKDTYSRMYRHFVPTRTQFDRIDEGSQETAINRYLRNKIKEVHGVNLSLDDVEVRIHPTEKNTLVPGTRAIYLMKDGFVVPNRQGEPWLIYPNRAESREWKEFQANPSIAGQSDSFLSRAARISRRLTPGGIVAGELYDYLTKSDPLRPPLNPDPIIQKRPERTDDDFFKELNEAYPNAVRVKPLDSSNGIPDDVPDITLETRDEYMMLLNDPVKLAQSGHAGNANFLRDMVRKFDARSK